MFRTQSNEDAFVSAVSRVAAALEQLVHRSEVDATLVRKKTFYDIQQLAAAGQKIDAIKLFRELTGAGLKDAKDVIDRMGF